MHAARVLLPLTTEIRCSGPVTLLFAGAAWVNGQGDINDYATISRATRKNAARQVARSAARAWRSGKSERPYLAFAANATLTPDTACT